MHNFSLSILYIYIHTRAIPCTSNIDIVQGIEERKREMELKKGSLMVIMLLMVMGIIGEAQLFPNFYRSTCPNVESIVRQAVTRKIQQTFVTVPATLRLFFHDCFVEVYIYILRL